jgi:hypothetical protein
VNILQAGAKLAQAAELGYCDWWRAVDMSRKTNGPAEGKKKFVDVLDSRCDRAMHMRRYVRDLVSHVWLH